MDKYGSLEIWNTQGMEKSHYRARGGRVCSCYLEEMFNWFFRNTFGRKLQMERAQATSLARAAQRRRRGTNASQHAHG